jgi:phthiodiolone/phenolphthiodiolone dimycocerosates ketoreductase
MSPLRVGLIISPGEYRKMLSLAVFAEKNGFDSLWVPDHIISRSYYRPSPDCWTMITLIAQNTARLMVGSGVTDPYRRHPAQLAQTVATLDTMFPRRIALGLGAGEAMNLVPFGINFSEPLQRITEAVECIRKLLTSTPDKPVSHVGTYYSLSNAFLTITSPTKADIPIYLGVMGKKARQLVGRLANGWYPILTTPQTYAEDLKEIERGAEKGGRKLEQIDCVARVHMVVSRSGERAREAARKTARVYLTLNPTMLKRLAPDFHFDRSFDVKNVIATKNLLQRIETIGQNIPDNIADMACAAGRPDDCIEVFEEYAKSGATHIVAFNADPNPEETIALCGSKILPYLKQQYG